MRYSVRNARCSYCSLGFMGTTVWIPTRHGSDWSPARILTLGRARGPQTIVRVQLEDHDGLLIRAFTTRHWLELRIRDTAQGGRDKPGPLPVPSPAEMLQEACK